MRITTELQNDAIMRQANIINKEKPCAGGGLTKAQKKLKPEQGRKSTVVTNENLSLCTLDIDTMRRFELVAVVVERLPAHQRYEVCRGAALQKPQRPVKPLP